MLAIRDQNPNNQIAAASRTRIMAVHNYYRSSSPSGENTFFDAQCDLLKSRGHEVLVHTRHSDELRRNSLWDRFRAGAATPWNPFEARRAASVVKAFRPDLVHVHNTFPLISPSIFHAISAHAITVITLHNFRLQCPAAIPLRSGKVCTQCVDSRSVLPSLLHRCYRRSLAATAPLAVSVALHQWVGTWSDKVDAFIVLSEFQKERMIKAGVPRARLHVLPNFVTCDGPIVPWDQRERRVLFVGRLSPEKGVATLVQAWRLWGPDAPPLVVVGSGPQEAALRASAAGTNVHFLGHLPPQEVGRLIATSRLVVMPSEWHEPFGLVVVEAFARGTPVAASAIGGLTSLVRDADTGILFPPGQSDALLDSVRTAWRSHERLLQLAVRARHEYEARFTMDSHYSSLMNVYRSAIATRRAVARQSLS